MNIQNPLISHTAYGAYKSQLNCHFLSGSRDSKYMVFVDALTTGDHISLRLTPSCN